ncbi:MAG: phosphoglycerate dehydrogenase [Actinobacteria bacterium]|nr:phosphoglycerate dehydrogenase [Actinomycetota bacterium]
MKVLVKEKIAQAGVDLLKEHFDVEVKTDMTDEELKERINDYDAIIVRSASKITADVLENAKQVKMIGRAGVGVDNIDVRAATQKGIVVANAPGSNSLSVAEHAIGLLLAQVREIPNANASMHTGKWEKSRFKGVEITDKVLGIMGLGKIGVLVAQRAKGLMMQVIAYDPYVSVDRFRELGMDRAETPAELYAASDFISVHLPKTPETMGMIGDEAFAEMKRGVRIINTARGGIVDEAALARALESGKVASAGLDVFTAEPIPADFPLAKFDNIVMTPHLGASTTEGQDRAGVIVAEQIVAGLTGGVVSYAVNIPSVSKEAMEAMGPFLPLAETLGQLMSAVADGPLSKVTVHYEGALADHDTRLLTLAATKGLVEGGADEAVNFVNAPTIAADRGLQVSEAKDRRSPDYTNLITIKTADKQGELTAGGTVFGPKNRQRLVKVYRHAIDIEPSAHMVFLRYEDVPGMIGKIGTIIGGHGINIAFMNVGRKKVEGKAIMGLALDDPLPPAALDEIRAVPGLDSVRAVELTTV